MISFLAHLPSAIFTQRGSKGQRNPGPELEEKPPSRSHIDLLAEQKHLEWLEAKEYEARIPEKEEQREEHRAESDIANKRLKALTLKLRRLNVQLESSVKARRLLNEEIARSRWGSTSNLEALYEQLRALNRQIESLSKRVGWVRTQISILKEVRRREDEAIKKLTYEIEKMKLGINRLDYPDPFVDFMEEKIFDPIFDRILP